MIEVKCSETDFSGLASNFVDKDNIVTIISEEDFRAGARAMFDEIAYRAANYWHPHHKYDNEMIMDWAQYALETVSPKDFNNWKSIDKAFEDGYSAGLRDAERLIPKTIIERIFWAFKKH